MSRSSRFALPAFWVVVALVALLLVGGVAAASPDEPSTSAISSVDSSLADGDSLDSPAPLESNMTYTVEIQTNGDAEWTVTERFNLSNDHDRQEFDDIASDFESETADGANFGFDAFVLASELVDAETDRDVAIIGESRTSTVEDDVGTLSLSFTWENFARIDGDRIVLDDVYETEYGLWLEGLSSGKELVIKSPDGFGFDDANVVPRQGQLMWEGPVSFTNQTLQAVLIGNGGEVNPGETPTQTETPGGNGSGFGSSLGLLALVIGGIGVFSAVLALSVIAVGTERIRTLLQRATERESAGEAEAETPAPATEGTESAGSDGEVDLELLSDEERVERLLEQNGGRMKQATIVKETGWSNAKVSQLLSSMEEENRIDKLRIGRENLISFPDEDITEIGDK